MILENLCAYLRAKKQLHPPLLYWRYCKDIQTSYFGYFGHPWLPKMIVSPCTRLGFLSACKKQTLSCILFLRYYILKNPSIWLAVLIWGLESCKIWDWWWNINNNISFHFRLFPRKTKDIFYKKILKEPILGQFWALFTQIRAKMNLPGKKSCQFLYIPIIYHCAKNQKKPFSNFWGKH